MRFLDFYDSWQLTDIYTDILVRQGAVQKSFVKAQFAGLCGSIDFDGSSPHEIMEFRFSGDLNEGVSSLLSENLKKSFVGGFGRDQVTIGGQLQRQGDSLILNGTANVFARVEERMDTLFFGAEFQKIDDSCEKGGEPRSLEKTNCCK